MKSLAALAILTLSCAATPPPPAPAPGIEAPRLRERTAEASPASWLIPACKRLVGDEDATEWACRRVLVKKMGLDEARLECIAHAADDSGVALCLVGLHALPGELETLGR